MGTEIKPNKNRTTFVRCPKDENNPFNRVPAKLYYLNGYQFAIMAQILSNRNDWNLVKYEIQKRLGFPERKFFKAWKDLEKLGYINLKRTWGSYHYTIYENPDYTTCTDADCVTHTTGSSTTCTGAILTTTNNNYYNEEVTATKDGNCHESQFNELLALYPSEGTKPDGTMYQLKGKRKQCKKAYIDYLMTNEMSHDEIMTALKVELHDKHMTGRSNYRPGLLRWIEDKTFELYRGRSPESAKVRYGETFE
jgi:hypothetical protein